MSVSEHREIKQDVIEKARSRLIVETAETTRRAHELAAEVGALTDRAVSTAWRSPDGAYWVEHPVTSVFRRVSDGTVKAFGEGTGRLLGGLLCGAHGDAEEADEDDDGWAWSGDWLDIGAYEAPPERSVLVAFCAHQGSPRFVLSGSRHGAHTYRIGVDQPATRTVYHEVGGDSADLASERLVEAIGACMESAPVGEQFSVGADDWSVDSTDIEEIG